MKLVAIAMVSICPSICLAQVTRPADDAAIRRQLSNYSTAHAEGSMFTLSIDAIRFVDEATVIVDGTYASQNTSKGFVMYVMVKRNGTWLIERRERAGHSTANP